MELNELQQLWSACDRRLDTAFRISDRLLREANLDRVQASLRRIAFGTALELALDAVLMLAIGSFAASHLHELRYVIPAISLGAFVLFLINGSIRQLAAIAAVHDDAPVVANQKRLEELRILRITMVKRIALLSPLIWTPMLIVLLRAILHIDPYVVPGIRYLAANLLFGIAFIPLMLGIAKHQAARLHGSRFLTRLADDIAGRNLQSARAFLEELRKFEEE